MTKTKIDFDARYSVYGYKGIAFYLKGYETFNCYDMDTEEEEERVNTDNVIAVMVGDDRKHVVSVDDLTLLKDDEYCSSCGQIGCGHGR